MIAPLSNVPAPWIEILSIIQARSCPDAWLVNALHQQDMHYVFSALILVTRSTRVLVATGTKGTDGVPRNFEGWP